MACPRSRRIRMGDPGLQIPDPLGQVPPTADFSGNLSNAMNQPHSTLQLAENSACLLSLECWTR